MLVSLTVGKVDAGVAVLLTEDKRLIEFPSILLPPDIHSGSIVDINVARNQDAELVADQKFSTLQSEIFEQFGSKSPSPPILRCRNATQTSVVLEWDPVELATSELRSLSLYRNGTKAGVIPRDKLSTKISGLALDTEYTFHLVLRTSAGQYSSEKLAVKTHKMTDLSGITVTPGVMPGQLKDSLAETVHRIGAKMTEMVRIDTTHFVCTEARGQAWEKAVEMNVPVVVPDWVKGCEREGRIVGVRGYYLDADPKLRQMGPSMHQQLAGASSPPVRDSPRIEHTPPTPDRAAAGSRRVPEEEDEEEAEEEEEEDEEDNRGPAGPSRGNEQRRANDVDSGHLNENIKAQEADDLDDASDATEKLTEDPEKKTMPRDASDAIVSSAGDSSDVTGERDEFSEVQL